MLKIKHLLCLTLGATACQVTLASTIEELAKRQEQMLLLDADIAIAKKKAELATILSGKTQNAPESSNASAAAAPQPPSAAPSKVAAPVPSAVVEGIAANDFIVNAIYGDVGHPTIEILYQGTKLARKRGDVVVEGWTIKSVVDNAITFVKTTKTKELVVTKYLSSTRAERRVGRDNEVVNLPPGNNPAAFPLGGMLPPPPPAFIGR